MRSVDQLKRFMEKVARQTRASGTNVNVAKRTNVQVASNVDRSGRTAQAHAEQHAPINQGKTE